MDFLNGFITENTSQIRKLVRPVSYFIQCFSACHCWHGLWLEDYFCWIPKWSALVWISISRLWKLRKTGGLATLGKKHRFMSMVRAGVWCNLWVPRGLGLWNSSAFQSVYSPCIYENSEIFWDKQCIIISPDVLITSFQRSITGINYCILKRRIFH